MKDWPRLGQRVGFLAAFSPSERYYGRVKALHSDDRRDLVQVEVLGSTHGQHDAGALVWKRLCALEAVD